MKKRPFEETCIGPCWRKRLLPGSLRVAKTPSLRSKPSIDGIEVVRYCHCPVSLGMKRARQIAPPSQNPAILITFPEGEVRSTYSSVCGAALLLAINVCSQRPQRGTDWAFASTAIAKAETNQNVVRNRFKAVDLIK